VGSVFKASFEIFGRGAVRKNSSRDGRSSYDSSSLSARARFRPRLADQNDSLRVGLFHVPLALAAAFLSASA
jgi:hypothetical protein